VNIKKSMQRKECFGRLCRQYGIETPYARRRRRLQECRKPPVEEEEWQ